MKSKTKIYIYGIAALVLMLVSIFCANINKDTMQTSSNVSLSNAKIEWGIKRAENHEQPDLGRVNLELINENGDIAIGNSEDKYIYLTFDNGYEAGYTDKILDTLKKIT